MELWKSLLLAIFLAFGSSSEASPSLHWNEPKDVAVGKGLKGPWQQNNSKYDYVDDPTVSLSNTGDVFIAWTDQSMKDLFFQKLPSKAGSASPVAQNVSLSPNTFSWLPRLFLSKYDPQTVFLIWQEIVFSGGSHGGEIFFARSTDGGTSFSKPLNLSRSVPGDGKGRINAETWDNGSLDLAEGPKGTLLAAWTEYDGVLWIARSETSGLSFSSPQKVAGLAGSKPARAPSLACGTESVCYLAWTTGDDPSADIHLAKSLNKGVSFQTPRTVAPSPGYSDSPRLILDKKGILHLVYGESSGGPFDSFSIRYTRSKDQAKTFDTPRVISNPAPDETVSSAFPELTADERSRLVVKWELFPAFRERPRGLAFALSADAGETFTQHQFIPESRDSKGGTNGSHQGLLMKKLGQNGRGDLVVANSSLKSGDRSRIWLMRATWTPK